MYRIQTHRNWKWENIGYLTTERHTIISQAITHAFNGEQRLRILVDPSDHLHPNQPTAVVATVHHTTNAVSVTIYNEPVQPREQIRRRPGDTMHTKKEVLAEALEEVIEEIQEAIKRG